MPYDLSTFNHHPPGSDANPATANTTSGNGHNTAAGSTTTNPIVSGGQSLNGGNTATAVSGQSQLFCVCGMSLQDLSAQERALIPTAPLDVLGGELFRHQGKIGELPPRLDSASGRRRSPSTSSVGSGIVASLKGRRGSTSSTRTAVTSALNAANGPVEADHRQWGVGGEEGSITASIKGRSPSISSALRGRRMSNSSSTAAAGREGYLVSGVWESGEYEQEFDGKGECG